jgi:rRNA processing protein Krr1/Pno1
MNTTKKEIIEYLVENCEDDTEYSDSKFHNVNRENWTIADLFVRQHLNNGSDGFGMENVAKVYKYLVKHKQELREYNLLSEDGINNFGYPLLKNYDIGWYLEGRPLEEEE